MTKAGGVTQPPKTHTNLMQTFMAFFEIFNLQPLNKMRIFMCKLFSIFGKKFCACKPLGTASSSVRRKVHLFVLPCHYSQRINPSGLFRLYRVQFTGQSFFKLQRRLIPHDSLAAPHPASVEKEFLLSTCPTFDFPQIISSGLHRQFCINLIFAERAGFEPARDCYASALFRCLLYLLSYLSVN